MIIREIYEPWEGERLYSVLLTEDEARLMSDVSGKEALAVGGLATAGAIGGGIIGNKKAKKTVRETFKKHARKNVEEYNAKINKIAGEFQTKPKLAREDVKNLTNRVNKVGKESSAALSKLKSAARKSVRKGTVNGALVGLGAAGLGAAAGLYLKKSNNKDNNYNYE